MDRKKIRRLAVPGGLAVLLVVLTACGPRVSDESCEALKNGGAKHTYTIENAKDDGSVKFQWIVKDDPDDDHFNRKGEEIKLGPKETTTRTVTVGKNDDGKRVQLFWPGPKGDDKTKFNKVAKSSC